MKRPSKIVSAIMVVSLMVLTTTGCGKEPNPGDVSTLSKSELLQAYQALQAQYNEQIATNTQLQNTLQALSDEGKVTPAISVVGDGTGRVTFNSNDSKIIFPNSFNYPTAVETQPDGRIDITSTVSIKPTSNWIVKFTGSALDVEQSTTGISGTFKVNTITQGSTPEQLKDDVIQPWFDEVAYTTVNYSNIFIGQTAVGVQAETPILIDSENAYLICGMAASGNTSITYIFVYRGSNDSTKDDFIKSLINTMTVNGNTVAITN